MAAAYHRLVLLLCRFSAGILFNPYRSAMDYPVYERINLMRSRLLTLCLIALFSPLSGATSDALQAFKSEMRAQVLQDIKQVPKNAFVRVWLHSSAEPIEGQFKYYRAYDYKLWIKLDNKFFVRAYDLDDIVAVKVIIRHSV